MTAEAEASASSPATRKVTPALRLARRAWRLQFRDSRQSAALAERAIARAEDTGEMAAEGWARLARGFRRMRYATPAEAAAELTRAGECLRAAQDRAGQILVTTGLARCAWLEGRTVESLEALLPLRGEGLQVLKREERGILLNGIAGCYSVMGRSADAFAYMYQALRESNPGRDLGFDVVLYNNLAHELTQLGDYHEALNYLADGIERCGQLANARLLGALLVNRVVCLTELNRPHDALPDIERVITLPADESGPGAMGAGFESMAIAALRAGNIALGAELVERAATTRIDTSTADEQVETVIAAAELLRARDLLPHAAERLEHALPLPAAGLSPRVRCLFHLALADVHEQLGHTTQSLQHLRTWQALHIERAHMASQARYQAASLQTELLRLQRDRDHIDARRRATERAKSELEAINEQLSQKIGEVQALQQALQEQAVRDFLTGLFNRRHLNDVLPQLLALAQRDERPLAVGIIDLDHFKSVNDRHGHAAGDHLLSAFGEMLGRRLRRSDVACRYGGEEFCVLMPRTDAATARRKLESLLKVWRDAAFAIEATTVSGMTFSAGVADSRQVSGSAQALLNAADACVLRAKQLGRHRIVVLDGTAIDPAHSAA